MSNTTYIFLFLFILSAPCYAQEENNNTATKQGNAVNKLGLGSRGGYNEHKRFSEMSSDDQKRPITKEIKNDCNEQGSVAVTIKVDREGKVISAEPGARGTTNPSKCLYDAAKEAALKTKFNSDPNAPEIQIGRIIYTFKLSE
jgi:outer membrane biosynthesis protein TonB